MSWVTIIWSMVPAACLTLAVIHLQIWSKNRAAWASLAFAVTALGVAGTAAGELLIMRSESPEEIGTAMRLTYIPITVLVIGLLTFVQLSFRNGRAWLGGLTVGLQGLALLLNFISGPNIVYRDISSVRQIEFLREPVSVVAQATGNPWIILDQLSALFVVAFVVDGTVRLWRGGSPDDRRKARRQKFGIRISTDTNRGNQDDS